MADKTRKEAMPMDDGRKSGSIPSNNASDIIKKEVDRITQKGNLTQKDLIDLHTKYPDEKIFDEIVERINKKYIKTREMMIKLAKKVWSKYQEHKRPLHEILEKMLRYKKEYKLSDFEYEEFRREVSKLFHEKNPHERDISHLMTINRSRINKALGNFAIQFEKKLHIKESDYVFVNEILALQNTASILHKSIFMHSLMYEDCSLVALNGEYRRERIADPTNYIHPVIACMFLPKFEIFETHMLHSSFGNIVQARHAGKRIVTMEDNLLLNDITQDPNDIVCEVDSPMADLRNRFKVQIKLWETVMKLRNGNYYDVTSINDFMATLNTCRNNIYDNAELAYSQDEGSILRKLMSVFSLRPTTIVTKPLATLSPLALIANPAFGQSNASNIGHAVGSINGVNMLNNIPFSNAPLYTITNVSMLTIHLPPYYENSEPIDIRNAAINQTIWLNENKTIVPKEQSVLYSKEVLIFYVNRRFQSVEIRTFTNPLNFAYTPLTMSSFEKLNAYPLSVPPSISLARSDEVYNLRSVVAVQETEIRQGEKTSSLITGSTGLIMTHRDLERQIYEPRYYLYDPFGASIPVKHPFFAVGNPATEGYILNKPITQIEPVSFAGQDANPLTGPSFSDRASRNGTIFIYAKPDGYTFNSPGAIII